MSNPVTPLSSSVGASQLSTSDTSQLPIASKVELNETDRAHKVGVATIDKLAEKPLLLLHFDLNKTLVVFDTALGESREDVIIHCLADTYIGKWAQTLEKPIPYSEYVKNHLLPGLRTDIELKKKRDEKISAFLEFLKEFDPSVYQKARQEYEHALDALTKQSTIVLTSFYSLVEYLKKNGYDFSIIMRTFGTDYVKICPEIEKIAHIHFAKKGDFKETKFIVEGDSDASMALPKEFYSFLKQNRHVVIHDDWPWWAKHGEKGQFGKPFPIDLADEKAEPVAKLSSTGAGDAHGSDEATTHGVSGEEKTRLDPRKGSVVSLFFDDNVYTEEHSEKNIVNPIDGTSGKSLEVYPLFQTNRIFLVDTIKAIEDNSYYIRLVKQALGL